IGIAADRGGGDAGRCADRAADDTGRDIARPEAAVVEAVVAVAPIAALPSAIPIGLIGIDLTLVAAAIVGASRSFVLAIGVRIELRAVAGIIDHFLRHGGAGESGRKDRRGGENSGFCHGLTPLRGPHAKRSRGRIVPALASNSRDAADRRGAARWSARAGLPVSATWRSPPTCSAVGDRHPICRKSLRSSAGFAPSRKNSARAGAPRSKRSPRCRRSMPAGWRRSGS